MTDGSSNAGADGGGADTQYFAHLAEGEWRIQRCGDCGTHVFIPRLMCPACGSRSLAWVAPSGAGTVYSTSVIRRRPQDGGSWNVALIDLAEGVRMMSRVDGIAPEDVKIGMTVTAKLVEEDGDTVVVFEPAGGESQ